MRAARLFALLTIWCSGTSMVTAATFEAETHKGRQIITISGELKHGDQRKFYEKILSHDEGIVFFDSIGGNLIAGLEIGKAIRLKRFTTAVMDGDLCASACALAWLGGTTRFAGEKAQIAFHAASRRQAGSTTESGAGNALVGSYLNSLGFSDEAIVFMTFAPPDSLETLTFAKAERYGIKVHSLAFTQASRPVVQEQPRTPTALPPASDERQISQTPTPTIDPSRQWSFIKSPEVTPQVLELADLDSALQVQRRLEERGYFRGLKDGVWGVRSRIALRDFKIQNRLGADDAWDLRTQLALFHDGYQMASPYYTASTENTQGLFVPFSSQQGTNRHPLNLGDAAAIQAALFQLGYYRKQGDGVWGMASRSALLDFKVANGLPADGSWSATVEEAIGSSNVVPASSTPFGEWVQAGGSCTTPGRAVKLAIYAKTLTAGALTCEMEPNLQRVTDGWAGVAKCSKGNETVPARIQLELSRGRLIDRSVIGMTPNLKPTTFERCPHNAL